MIENKNFDRVFYFTYSPGMNKHQSQAALSIDFSGITNEYDIVDIQQSPMADKIIVTLFARKK